MTKQDKKLWEADIKADWIAAIIRVGIFLTLVAIIVATAVDVPIRHHAIIDVSIFGLVTLVSFILAAKRIYRPWLPFLFATFDVVLVVAHMRFMSAAMSLDTEMFMLPAALFTMIMLTHASIRFQPLLPLYIASLFILTTSIIGNLPISPMMPVTMIERMRDLESSGHRMLASVFAVELLPLVIVATAALILVVQNQRSRQFLEDSINEARQAARLSRFFSPGVAKRLTLLDSVDSVDGRREKLAILFVDIRGFTSLSEKIPADEVAKLLSRFREKVATTVFEFDGMVDKFIGDAVLIVFGAPEIRGDEPQRALDCSIAVIKAVQEWSKEREAHGAPSIEVGIGGHFGEVFIGVVGNGPIREYTVIGDTVNIAERLERLTREINSDIVISDDMLDQIHEEKLKEHWIDTNRPTLFGKKDSVRSRYLRIGA